MTRRGAPTLGTGVARDLAEVSRSRIHHLFSNFPELDRGYRGAYPLVIEHGEGQYLYDSVGRRLLDAAQHLGACGLVRDVAPRVLAAVRS